MHQPGAATGSACSDLRNRYPQLVSDFELSRSTSIQAPVGTLHALVDDFHEWVAWSPWEGVDPDLQRTYTGPERGVGAAYAWTGNRKAGQGSMEITGVTD